VENGAADRDRVLSVDLGKGDQRAVELNVATQAGNLIGDIEALAAMRTDGAINGAEAE
jgi:hypothetical protein